MWKIRKTMSFEAAHLLPTHKGKCKALHGHSYKVEIEVSSDALNSEGMLIDFGDIKAIVDEWDHVYLNNLPEFQTIPPTAERMAEILCKKILARRTSNWTVTVRLCETESSLAEYTGRE